MFTDVTTTRWEGRVVRRGLFAIGSVVAQAIFLAFVIGDYRAPAARNTDPVVEVKLVKPVRPGPAGTGLSAPPRPASERPKVRAPKPAAPPVIQPKEIPAALTPEPEPDPVAESTALVDASSTAVGAGPGGAGDGIVGGVLEGEGGGVVERSRAPATRTDFDDTMTAPKFQQGPSIEYSAEGLQQRVEGLMIVRCVVTVEGRVYGCRVIKSLPYMDEAVVSVLEARRYSPATRNGVPLEVNYTFRIRLRLPR